MSYPLQPLYDDLSSMIYEDFERDPIKYKSYQDAIESALSDMTPEEEAETAETKTLTPLTLMIVGAGRGPFIRSAINASKNIGRPVKIVVVEKNLNALLTLDDLTQRMWPELGIELIHEDMRRLKYEGKADILISELLGSFGDNELSPECLDGAQQSLKPGTGISIPFKSISYIQPVMSTMMHHQLSSRMDEKPREMNWVSFLSRVFYIDDAKEVFTFVHPNHEEQIDNTRHAKLEFTANVDCQLDGFCGYFTAKLYKNIEISINPKTFSKGLISWYPIIFPSLHRVYIKKGETFTIEIWRRVDDTKVWYEWKINDGIIANVNGESSPIKL